MNPTPPKRKKRRWPWVLVVGFTVVGVALLVLFPWEKVERGDKGYRRLLSYYQRREKIESLDHEVPGIMHAPMNMLFRKESERFLRQLHYLQESGYTTELRMILTNVPAILTNGLAPPSDEKVKLRISEMVGDKRYSPIVMYSSYHDTCIMIALTCRSNEANIYRDAFGSSNAVNVARWVAK